MRAAHGADNTGQSQGVSIIYPREEHPENFGTVCLRIHGKTGNLTMTALQFLLSIPHVPMAFLGEKPVKASKSEQKRWLENGSVIINGAKPKPHDEITFPVTELVFFPKSKRRCTMQSPAEEVEAFKRNQP